jgi:hypothetical protein
VKDEVKTGHFKDILSEVKEILRKGGGSVSEGLLFTAKARVQIAGSVNRIRPNDFRSCISLCEVTFSADSQVREIAGFSQCRSLCRIEIPSSIEIITNTGFSDCESLNEIIFSVDSHLRVIGGFRNSSSVCRIEIPFSVDRKSVV